MLRRKSLIGTNLGAPLEDEAGLEVEADLGAEAGSKVEADSKVEVGLEAGVGLRVVVDMKVAVDMKVVEVAVDAVEDGEVRVDLVANRMVPLSPLDQLILGMRNK